MTFKIIRSMLAIGLLAALSLVAQSQGHPIGSSPTFEVASVRPSRSSDGISFFQILPSGRVAVSNSNVKAIIEFAYDIRDDQLSGGPGWISSDSYDIEAAIADFHPDPGEHQIRQMFQNLLKDRFGLQISHRSKTLPVYELEVGRNGPKILKSTSNSRFGGRTASGEMTFGAVTLSAFADALSEQVGRHVLDKTELEGLYDIVVHWVPEDNQSSPTSLMDGSSELMLSTEEYQSADSSLLTAIQEQLGLALRPSKDFVEAFRVDNIARPSEN